MNNALGILIVGATLMSTLFLSIKVAEYHYKTYKGEYPLFIIYGMIGIIIWASIITFIFEQICI